MPSLLLTRPATLKTRQKNVEDMQLLAISFMRNTGGLSFFLFLYMHVSQPLSFCFLRKRKDILAIGVSHFSSYPMSCELYILGHTKWNDVFQCVLHLCACCVSTVGQKIFAVENFCVFVIQCITQIFLDFYFRG